MAEEGPPVLSEKAMATVDTTSDKPSSHKFNAFFHKDNEKHEEEKPNVVQVDAQSVEDYFQPVGFTQLFQ